MVELTPEVDAPVTKPKRRICRLDRAIASVTNKNPASWPGFLLELNRKERMEGGE